MGVRLKVIALIVMGLCSSQLAAAEYGTFESFYHAGGFGIWGWIFIATASLATAVIAFFTAGAPIPVWMATVGAWIGSTVGLSGAAAVNFGLALLGGGAIASGGLGIAGGVAVLSAALTFGSSVIVNYSTAVALEEWNQTKFVEANKGMVTLPVVRNKKGGDAYCAAFSYLDKHIQNGKVISEQENQQVLAQAIEILSEKMPSEKDRDYILKDKTLLALLYFQTNNYPAASKEAEQAVFLADEIREKKTMPLFIWAVSEIAKPDTVCSEKIMRALRLAYLHEPENKLMAIMTGVTMDRLMYRYHYGQLSIEHLTDFCKIITDLKVDKELSAASLEIFTTRCLIELKRTQNDILIVKKDKKKMRERDVIVELRKRLNRHEALISLLQKDVLPQVYRLQKNFSDKSTITPENLTSLLDAYYKDLSNLGNGIE